ncbi:DMP19 family protein [Nocardioides jejuensis]|uniref:DMP19 family protein n=1 Tax=Nocardioides jejuensis TaxID=2502782 RepID=UPI001405516C|nr:DUF4375 domain-containing protein [Nocardioides jejuensis]
MDDQMRVVAALSMTAVLSVTACSGSGKSQQTPSDSTPTAASIDSVTPMPTDDAWDLYERLGDGDRSALSTRQQAVFAICDLRQEVNSGGFDSYFRSWGGDTAQVALVALPEALGDSWAALLQEAMRTLGPQYPADADARSDLLEDRDVIAELNELDSRLYELEEATDADDRVNAYLAAAP